MSEGGYKFFDQGGVYFVSFAVVGWVDVFTRKEYRDIVIESLQHCQREQGLIIYAWCIMSNHIHLIISAKENNVSDVLGNFKKFTSKKIVAAIQSNPSESRKEWMRYCRQSRGIYSQQRKRLLLWNTMWGFKSGIFILIANFVSP